MSWFVLAIISVLAYSVSSLIQRILMKDEKSDSDAYSVLFQVVCSFWLFLFAFWEGFQMPPLHQFPVNVLLLTIAYAVGTIYTFKSLQTTDVSEINILFTSRSFWTILIAVFYFKRVD